MKIFVTGATGYIGGSVAHRLIADGHQVIGLVRSVERAALLEERGIEPLVGVLDDAALLAQAAGSADAVINTANADHQASIDAMLPALAQSGKRLIHTSGSSIVGTRAGGTIRDEVFDEDTPFKPSPARVARVALNQSVLASATDGVHPIVIAPSLIYGHGLGVHRDSMQVPWLLELARANGGAQHIGPGTNVWSNVYIDDLVELYMLALADAPAGSFYFAENGENSMLSVCQAISRMLGHGGATSTISTDAAAQVWGEGPANDTMGSNSRVRARRARAELGWLPVGPSLISEIDSGCYAQDAR